MWKSRILHMVVLIVGARPMNAVWLKSGLSTVVFPVARCCKQPLATVQSAAGRPEAGLSGVFTSPHPRRFQFRAATIELGPRSFVVRFWNTADFITSMCFGTFCFSQWLAISGASASTAKPSYVDLPPQLERRLPTPHAEMLRANFRAPVC